MALFDKFAYSETPGSAIPVAERIAHNLNRLLNTRRDFDALLPSCGLNDVQGGHPAPELLPALMDEILDTITHYEPRLEQVSIHPETPTHAAQLRFRIDCRMAHKPHRFFVVLKRTAASRPQ